MFNGFEKMLENIDIKSHIENEIKKSDKPFDIDWKDISSIILPILMTILKDNLFPWILEQLGNKEKEVD